MITKTEKIKQFFFVIYRYDIISTLSVKKILLRRMIVFKIVQYKTVCDWLFCCFNDERKIASVTIPFCI